MHDDHGMNLLRLWTALVTFTVVEPVLSKFFAVLFELNRRPLMRVCFFFFALRLTIATNGRRNPYTVLRNEPLQYPGWRVSRHDPILTNDFQWDLYLRTSLALHFKNAIIRDTIDDIEKKVTYQCGDRYDKMRVIRLQVSAMWYSSDGGASRYWIWDGGGRRELSCGCFDEQDIRRVVAEAEFGNGCSSSSSRRPTR